MSSDYCSAFSYFNTSEFLELFLHLFGMFSIPIYLFGTYVILFKTPPAMVSVRLNLLNFHLCSCIFDVGLSILTTPYIIFPAMAGYPLGLLKEVGLGTAEQTFLMLALVGVVFVAVIGILENRMTILFFRENIWHRLRFPCFVLNYIFALSFFIPAYILIPDQKVALKTVTDIVMTVSPCVPSYIDLERVFFLSIRLRVPIWTCLIAFSTFFGEMLIFSIGANAVLQLKWNQRKMSEHTIKLHRNFRRALVLQLLLPFLILLLPFIYLGISSAFYLYHNQAYNNVCIIILSSHGLFSTFAILLIHRPYREYTTSILGFGRLCGTKIAGSQSLRMEILSEV